MQSFKPIIPATWKSTNKGTGDMARAVECLLSKHKALSLNSSTIKKNKRRRKKMRRRRKRRKSNRRKRRKEKKEKKEEDK
jgi:hypothetical protein